MYRAVQRIQPAQQTMLRRPALARLRRPPARSYSGSAPRRDILDVSTLPQRIEPRYEESKTSSLLSLHWPQAPRNILLIPKLHAPQVTLSAVAFAKHLHGNYPDLNLVFEGRIANAIHDSLPFPIYTTSASDPGTQFPDKIDLVTTLGGDGTILRAASLFSLQPSVPPILSFSMGSLGFLGEWKFDEYKRAWREVYMSGSGVPIRDLTPPADGEAGLEAGDELHEHQQPRSWEGVRVKNMGAGRVSKMLLRHRL